MAIGLIVVYSQFAKTENRALPIQAKEMRELLQAAVLTQSLESQAGRPWITDQIVLRKRIQELREQGYEKKRFDVNVDSYPIALEATKQGYKIQITTNDNEIVHNYTFEKIDRNQTVTCQPNDRAFRCVNEVMTKVSGEPENLVTKAPLWDKPSKVIMIPIPETEPEAPIEATPAPGAERPVPIS